MNPITRAINFFKESKVELSKVVWPKRTEIFRDTLLVILTILISTAIIFAFDFLLVKLVQIFVVR